MGEASLGGSRLADVSDVMRLAAGSGSTRGELGRDSTTVEGAEMMGLEEVNGKEDPAWTGRGEMIPGRSESRGFKDLTSSSSFLELSSSVASLTSTGFFTTADIFVGDSGVMGAKSSSASARRDLDDHELLRRAGEEGGGDVTALAASSNFSTRPLTRFSAPVGGRGVVEGEA